jgi:hypothetical protein
MARGVLLLPIPQLPRQANVEASACETPAILGRKPFTRFAANSLTKYLMVVY